MSDDKSPTTTQKMRATARAEIDRAMREQSNHTAPKPDTDDLPITRKNIRATWALVVVLLSGMGTSATVVWKAFESVADLRHQIAVNTRDIATMRETMADERRDSLTERGQISTRLNQIDVKLADISATLREMRGR